MAILQKFDPWKSPLCTCPEKYSLNPYTGCGHGCLYCYASSYIRDFFRPRPKKISVLQLRREVKRLGNPLIALSNSTDPYQPLEREHYITRRILEALVGTGARVLVTTKSDLVVRDADLLSKLPSAVMITITTMNEEIASEMEPGAPKPRKRVKALAKLAEEGIPVGIRLDPIIYGLNDSEESIKEVLQAAAKAGAKHVVSSTFKPRVDSWKRMVAAFPELKQTKTLYAPLKPGSRTYYLKKELRRELMEKVKRIVEELGLSFAVCREGFTDLISALSCDGSHLVNRSLYKRIRKV